MKKLLFFCHLLILLALPCTYLQAADLLEIYRLAVANDASLQASLAQRNADAEALPQSRATLLPNLTVTANTQTIDRDISGGIEERFNSNGYAAQLTQPLFRADRWFQTSSAKASKQQSDALYRDAQQELIVRVATAYFNILRAEDNLTAAQARETAFRQQLEQANERFRVGLIAATDVYEAQAGYDLARVERISSQEARHNSFAALATLTNQTYTDIDALDKSMPIAGPTPTILANWIATALANNNLLAAKQYQIQAAREQIKAEKSGHLPTIDAKATYSHSEDGGTSFLGNESDTQIFALELTLPLFEGGGRNSKIREAHYRHEQARQDFESTYRQLREEVQTQHRTVTTDAILIQARQAALKSSEAALEATLGGYDAGTRNIVDVLQAQNNNFNALRDYANATYDYIIDLLALKRLAGTLGEEDLTELNQWLRAGTDSPD